MCHLHAVSPGNIRRGSHSQASFRLGVCVCVQGDWGTQFGMLIQFLAEAREAGLADPSIAKLSLAELQVRLFADLIAFTLHAFKML